MIEDCQLTELELKGGKFTWEKGRGTNDRVRECLDKAFASTQWWSKFPLCNLNFIHTSRLDHDPIQLDLMHIIRFRKEFRFRFENTWLCEPLFIKEVSENWGGLPAINLLPKLMSISSFMARWGMIFFHKFREKVKYQKAVIERLFDRVDADGVKEYLLEKNKLNDLLLHEELYWKQKEKIFWLAEGDENTKFFHVNASARKRNNKDSYLINDQGDRVDDHVGMCDIVSNYFKGVFVGEVVDNFTNNAISPRTITATQNVKLTEKVSYENFTEAIKQMHPDKASGPNGLNPAFFQTF